MFDPTTERLISSAPPLPPSEELGLGRVSPKELARELTAAFSEVSAARLRINSAASQPGDEAEAIGPIIRRLRRMAETYESLVCLGQGEVNQPAAFVAGVARQLIGEADAISRAEGLQSYLSDDAISSDVAAMLLFLAAEAHADAATTAKKLAFPDDSFVPGQLLVLLRGLGQTQFFQINTYAEVVGLVADRMPDDHELAGEYLYSELSGGIVQFSREMLGLSDPGQAEQIFREVQDAAIAPFDIPGLGTAFSTFPGPHHLASLLLVATAGLGELALVRTAPPSGLSDLQGAQWTAALGRLAERRPLVWRNHRGALQGGILDHGTSAVMNFPTGSGKTTLSVLKIIAARLGKGSTVYLAPTHALCDQISKDLEEDLQGIPDVSIGELGLDDFESPLPSVAVLTPEQCLSLLAFRREAFVGVGLLVFDECHLLHPGDGAGRGRRALDAMLALLAFIDACPSADILMLSAMICNAGELADWLESLGRKPCVAFEDPWRPTRQARAVVLYAQSEIQKIARGRSANNDASPFALFNLVRGWNPGDSASSLIIRLLNAKVPLKRTRTGVSANRNEVAAQIALATQSEAHPDLSAKILIFAENSTTAHSIAKRLTAALGREQLELTSQEQSFRRMAIAELGSEEGVVNKTDDRALVHHGDLIPPERGLVESLFRRQSGVNIVVATTTLSQGLNLPCEMVVVAGTDRFDDSVAKPGREDVPAHELLNALGRAGRAGLASSGVSIVVPGKLIVFNNVQIAPTQGGQSLLARVFSKSDNCLTVEDPLSKLLLDRLDSGLRSQDQDFQHTLRRLRLSLHSVEGETAGGILRRSLSAFRAHRRGDEAWLGERIARANALIAETIDPRQFSWRDEIAAHAGLPVATVRKLEQNLHLRAEEFGTFLEAAAAVLDCALSEEGQVRALLRPRSLERVLGFAPEQLEAGEYDALVMEVCRTALPLWMGGSTLKELDDAIFAVLKPIKARVLRKPRPQSKSCVLARRSALQLVPELAFIATVCAQVYRRTLLEVDEASEPPAELLRLSGAIRAGFSCPEQISLWAEARGSLSRTEVHRAVHWFFARGFLVAKPAGESAQQLRKRVSGALAAAGGIEAIIAELGSA